MVKNQSLLFNHSNFEIFVIGVFREIAADVSGTVTQKNAETFFNCGK
jgi:hypothetical protein